MDNFTKAYLDIINESSNEKQFVVMWYINGTSTEGIWTCIAHTKSEAEAEANFKKTLPRRKKYNDPKYNVSDVLIYELDEKTPENIDEITKEEILKRSWRNKTNKSSNEPIKGSCRSMFSSPVVKGLFGEYRKK